MLNIRLQVINLIIVHLVKILIPVPGAKLLLEEHGSGVSDVLVSWKCMLTLNSSILMQ